METSKQLLLSNYCCQLSLCKNPFWNSTWLLLSLRTIVKYRMKEKVSTYLWNAISTTFHQHIGFTNMQIILMFVSYCLFHAPGHKCFWCRFLLHYCFQQKKMRTFDFQFSCFPHFHINLHLIHQFRLMFTLHSFYPWHDLFILLC